ncbi:MAG: FtsX-like permease family protein, partial [Bacteroidales bacterium]|nr:FtsX-like permease family protein [Bacteroidales bacterium]
LIISIINFVNLATATSAARAKEIGIRKVAGAQKRQLIIQFLGESLMISFVAVIIALLIAEFILPVFNNFSGKELSISNLFGPANFLILIALWLLTGCLSGLYPALYLSSFSPVNVIEETDGNIGKSGVSRKILVIAQFTISVFMIISTIAISSQLRYMQSADLGFSKENIVVIPIYNTSVSNVYPAFKKELLNYPDIMSVTAVDDIFGISHNTHEFRPEGFPEDQWQFYPALVVRYDFVKTFEIEIVEGRDYNKANKTDPINGILINEAMVKHLGWNSNEDVLGKKFESFAGKEKVIGIFRNFYATSLHEPSGPFVLNMKENPNEVMWFLKYLVVKVVPGKKESSLKVINDLWDDFSPNRPFEYFFLEDEITAIYKDESNLSRLAIIFTVVIILLSLVGLLGLVSFISERKTKEIGIRKVLGASRLNIVFSLSKEFIFLILISSILACAAGYLLINYWLSYFASRIEINWLYFVGSSLVALFLALFIWSARAYFASGANPSETLKYQ